MACCIAGAAPAVGDFAAVPSDKNSDLTFDVVNNCGEDLEILEIDTSWTDIVGTPSELQFVEWPTGTQVFTFSVPKPTPAVATFGFPPLLSMFNDNANPLSMLLDFTDAMAAKLGGGLGTATEELTVKFTYMGSGVSGTCTFRVSADEDLVEVL